MEPDKRKKLDEIKKRRKLLEEQLHQQKEKKNKPPRSIEEEAKEALKLASKTKDIIESDELINKTQNNILKMMKSQRIQELSTTNFYEQFPAFKPEMYEEGTQYTNLKKEEEDEDSESEDKEQKQEKPKQPLVVKKNKQAKNVENKEEEKKEYIVLPEEEGEKYENTHKEEIIEFLKSKIKYMERAINQKDIYDMLLDDDYVYLTSLSESNDLIHPILEFYDKSTESRTITAIEWSLKYPELLLSCYTKRADDLFNHPNGLIHIWNLGNRTDPQFTFTNQAEITSAIFHPYNPKLIIGGTETGIVMLWDTRGKQAPIYKTPLGVGSSLGSKSHTSEITCLGVIGSINSSHIVSLSNGIMCLWSLSNMSTPVKKLDLKTQGKKENEVLNELNVLSMGMQQNDTNNLFIGCDDYNAYQISLNEESLGNCILNSFKGHEGPVYSIDFHPNEFSHIFATSSADWTTKIWNKQNNSEPIITLENSDNYVYCSKWSPVHPSILAIGDGDGYLNIMDLNKDIESPIIHCKLGNIAINKICWSEDGKRITVGGNDGKIQLFGLDKKLYNSTSEDVKMFGKVIGQKK